APQLCVVDDGVTKSTVDLFVRCFVLLSGLQDGPWPSAAQAAAAKLGVPLVSYRIGAGPDFDLDTTAADGTDGGGADWAAVHCVTSQGAVLVRPDGIVAWRSVGLPADPAHELTHILEGLLSR
ncbi:aromatic-ring hydroxylase C-terminal domain-containing protein, partial [Streptomyces diastatochromogenes]